MAEREQFWSAPPEWETAEITRAGFSARPVLGLGQVLVSGRLDAAREALAPGTPEAGLWSLVEGDRYFVRIARDRALLVTSQPLAIQSGWRAEGFAASPADDAWSVFELEGESLRDVVAEAVSADLDRGSPSAAVPFAGVTALLYRTAENRARLHLERAFAAFVWQWLETRKG
jgi:sarcosine oxidase gamma subunit